MFIWVEELIKKAEDNGFMSAGFCDFERKLSNPMAHANFFIEERKKKTTNIVKYNRYRILEEG